MVLAATFFVASFFAFIKISQSWILVNDSMTVSDWLVVMLTPV